MIAVDIAGHRFQLRAAAIVIHDGHLLVHRLEGDDYWSLPGGRVEPGEDARSTLVREMDEELGEPLECGELLYVVENFFTGAGRPFHELGLYFRADFRGDAALLDKARTHAGVEGARRLEFRWLRTDGLRTVDLRPAFLRDALARPTLRFEHVVQRD